MAGWNSPSHLCEVPDRLWRTLVADRTSLGERPPAWWRSACAECLEGRSYSGDLNTKAYIHQHPSHGMAVEYLQRVQAVVCNRKLFSIQGDQEDLLGLGPRDIEIGDVIAILYGCSVPVVLRRQNSSMYTLVGECYVHERMDGETLAHFTPEDLERSSVDFEII